MYGQGRTPRRRPAAAHFACRHNDDLSRTPCDLQEYRQRKRHEDQVRRAAVRASYEQTRQKYQSMVKKFYSRWAGITFGQKGARARRTAKCHEDA